LTVFRELFESTTCYRASVPAYIGGDMTFGWGSDDTGCADVPLGILWERFKDAAIETDYYTPDVHRGAFALPRYISRLVG
jgi:spermidine synthase